MFFRYTSEDEEYLYAMYEDIDQSMLVNPNKEELIDKVKKYSDTNDILILVGILSITLPVKTALEKERNFIGDKIKKLAPERFNALTFGLL